LDNIIDCAEDFNRYDPFCGNEQIPGFRSDELTRFISVFSADYMLSDRISINPRLLIQDFDRHVDLLPQLLIDYVVHEKFSLTGGGGINSYDPMFYQLILGARYNNISLFMAFDTNFKGGSTPGFLEESLELSVSYSFSVKNRS